MAIHIRIWYGPATMAIWMFLNEFNTRYCKSILFPYIFVPRSTFDLLTPGQYPGMRKILLFLFCIISLSASAQFWPFKKHERLPLLEQTRLPSFINFNLAPPRIPQQRLYAHTLNRSDYSLEVEEHFVMKTAQHNMRYRVYKMASYNFNELARLYVLQNRFSEAKWYFLQSNFLSRQLKNDRLTISNLSNLAMVKSQIGDFVLAQQDLIEARNIAAAHGWLIDIIEVEKKLGYIQHNRFASLREDTRYAELAADN